MGRDFTCCHAFYQHLASMTAPEFAQIVLHDALGAAHIVTGEDFCFGKGLIGDVKTLKALGFFFQAEVGIRALTVTGVQTCALPISGDKLRRGEKFGMIKFGSTTELILPRPSDVSVHVAKGDKVKAGLTRLATLDPP